MIRLTLIGADEEAAVVDTSEYYRITGGVVWTRPGRATLATYVEGRWRYQALLCSGMRFEGPGRLIFGISSEPAGVSEPLQSLAIDGEVLSVNGVPFALYEPTRDMWHRVDSGSWWQAFRIESVELRELPGQAPSAGRSTDPSQPLGDPEHKNPTGKAKTLGPTPHSSPTRAPSIHPALP